MKGDKKVIDLLNEVLTNELTTINQYFLHARMCENWGYERLWKKVKHESIDEMKHADRVIERILYLDGLPNVQRLGKVTIGEKVVEMLKVDLALEVEAVARLNDGIKVCHDAGDSGSHQLLESILASEETHVRWLEAQRTQVQQMGEPQYLAEQLKKS